MLYILNHANLWIRISFPQDPHPTKFSKTPAAFLIGIFNQGSATLWTLLIICRNLCWQDRTHGQGMRMRQVKWVGNVELITPSSGDNCDEFSKVRSRNQENSVVLYYGDAECPISHSLVLLDCRSNGWAGDTSKDPLTRQQEMYRCMKSLWHAWLRAFEWFGMPSGTRNLWYSEWWKPVSNARSSAHMTNRSGALNTNVHTIPNFESIRPAMRR